MADRRAGAAALAAALLLAGCAAAPPSDRMRRPELPDGSALEAAAAATAVPQLQIDRWWMHFDDPQLEAQIAAALAGSADLAVAAARLREARAQLDQAAAAQGPGLEVQASSGRSRVAADAAGGDGRSARIGAAHRAALVAGHDIDLWGRLDAGTRAARERLQAQAWARAAVEWGLTAQVAEAHFGLRAVGRQVDIARAVRQGRLREVELRRSQHAAGTGAELDLRRSEAELATAQATLAALSRRELALHKTLSLLTGMPIEQQAVTPGPRPDPMDPARPFEARLPQGRLAQLLVRRPDVRQAESELMAAQADVASARAATLPTLRLTGSVGSDVRELSHLFSGPGLAWSLAASLVQSVFDGGRAQARVHETEARSAAALARYRQAVAAAVADVREAYLGLEVDGLAWLAARQRVASLAHALELARAGQRAGVSSQLDMLDAERNHFQAQLAEVDAYRDRLLGQVAAFKALGGGHSADAIDSDDPTRTGATQ